MRVIAGSARGRPLTGPPGSQTRPTSDKVRGALFSMAESLLAAERPRPTIPQEELEPGLEEVWEGLTRSRSLRRHRCAGDRSALARRGLV